MSAITNFLFYSSFFIIVISAINVALTATNAQKGGMNLVHRFAGADQAEDTPINYTPSEKRIYYVIGIAAIVAAVTLMMKE